MRNTKLFRSSSDNLLLGIVAFRTITGILEYPYLENILFINAIAGLIKSSICM